MVTLSQVKRKLERYKVSQADFTLANFMAYVSRKEESEQVYDARFEEGIDLCKLLSSGKLQGGEKADFSPTKPKRGKHRGDAT